MTSKTTLNKHKTRLTGLLLEKIDDISDTMSQFPDMNNPYVKLKFEEKNALRYAIKLLEKEMEKPETKAKKK